MCDSYMQDILRRVTAQICQTIGYHATQTTPLELLQDILQRYLLEFARNLRRHVEHCNRDEANMNDVALTMRSLNINVHEIIDYVNNVEPVLPCVDVPKLPLRKESNLNFLKPGSKEVLLRPMHIYEYLPPMLPPEVEAEQCDAAGAAKIPQTATSGDDEAMLNATSDATNTKPDETTPLTTAATAPTTATTTIASAAATQHTPTIASFLVNTNTAATSATSASATNMRYDEEGRPTREIHSVVMTSGGFISPAIEGKLPDSIIPAIIEKLQGLDAPPPPTPPPPPPPLPTATSHSTQAKHLDMHSNRKGDTADGQKAASKATSQSLGGSTGAAKASERLDKQNWTQGSKTQSSKNKGNNALNNVTSTSTTYVSKLLKKAKKKIPSGGGMPFAALSSNLNGKVQKNNANKFDAANVSSRTGEGGSRKNLPSPSDGVSPDYFKNIEKLTKSKGAPVESGAMATALPQHIDLENLARSNSQSAMGMASLKSGTKTNLIANSMLNTDGINSLDANAVQMTKLLKKQNKKRQKKLKQQQQQQHQHDLSEDFHKNQVNATMAQLLKSTGATSSPFSVAPTMAPKLDSMNRSTGLLMPGSVQFGATSQNEIQSSSKLFGDMQFPSMGGLTAVNTLSCADEQHQKQSAPMNMEIKLSNEPDRSKLDIFKKISKPKSGNKQTHSPHSHAENTVSSIYDSQLVGNTKINLPSGTTITPAPLPTQLGANALISTEKAMGFNAAAAPPQSQPTQPPSSIMDKTIVIDDDNSDMLSVYEDGGVKINALDGSSGATAPICINVDNDGSIKPKKRGRKPGCRNSSTNKLAMKTFNMNLNTCAGTVNSLLPPPSAAHPKTTVAGGGAIGSPLHPIPMKKSKKLNKMNKTTRNADSLSPGSQQQLLSSVGGKALNLSMMDHQNVTAATTQPFSSGGGKKSQSPLNKKMKTNAGTAAPGGGAVGPTKEEVNSINRKLKRMDTTLKPLTPLSTTSSGGDGIITDVEAQSMYKSGGGDEMRSLLPGKKSRSFMSPASGNASTLMSPTARVYVAAAAAREAAAVSAASGGSNVTTAPPASAVPGSLANLPPQMLLPLYSFSPRPGLIPTPANLLASGGSGSGPGMLLPTFLPYPSASMLPLPKGGAADDNDKKISTPPIIDEERNYCNVAPLVQDSMKLTLSSSGSGSAGNRSLSDDRRNVLSDATSLKMMPSITLNADEPIEVSDDSCDEAFASNSGQFKSRLSKGNTLLMPASSSSAMMRLQPTQATSTGSDLSLNKDGKDASNATASSTSSKNSKKLKKLSKSSKQRGANSIDGGETNVASNHMGISSNATTALTASDVFRLTSGGNLKGRQTVALDGGISKLAGGADLIPIGTATATSSGSSGVGGSGTSTGTTANQSLLLGFGVNRKEVDYGMSIMSTSSTSTTATAPLDSATSMAANLTTAAAALGDAANMYGHFNTKKSLLSLSSNPSSSSVKPMQHHMFDCTVGGSGTTGPVSSGSLNMIDLQELKKQQHFDVQKQKRKEHKKLKKVMKDSRIKKKKDKKDKNRSKEKYFLQHKLSIKSPSSSTSLPSTTMAMGSIMSTTPTSVTDKSVSYGAFEYPSNIISMGGTVAGTGGGSSGSGSASVSSSSIAPSLPNEIMKKMKKEKKKVMRQKQYELLHGINSSSGAVGSSNNVVTSTSTSLLANLNASGTNPISSDLNTTEIVSSASDAAAQSNSTMQPLLLPKLTLKFNSRSRSNSQSPTIPASQALNPTVRGSLQRATAPSGDGTGDGGSSTGSTSIVKCITSNALSGAGVLSQSIKQSSHHHQLPANSSQGAGSEKHKQRELSPELAKISPLVTRPPKQKAVPQSFESALNATALGFTCDSTFVAHETNNTNSGNINSNSSKNSGNSNINPGGSGINIGSASGAGNANSKGNSFAATQPHQHHRHSTPIIPPPSPWQSGGTLTASSVLLPQQLLQAAAAVASAGSNTSASTISNSTTVKSKHSHHNAAADDTATIGTALPSSLSASSSSSSLTQPHADGANVSTPATTSTILSGTANITIPATPMSGRSVVPNIVNEGNRPSSYIDAEGNRVWICPACGKVDDGSAMIGCDDCDAWYHWICVGIVVEPKDNEDWFCRVCITRRKGMHGEKKRKRNKKK